MEMVLFEPEIPPNTGNVARLCAAMKTRLNLVEPLGFSLEDKYLKRAGLDYWPHVDVNIHPNWDAFLEYAAGRRLVLTSARQGERYDTFNFHPDDMIIMGPETRGLPQELYTNETAAIRIPIWGEVRSLNMSTAAGILLSQAFSTTGLYPE